MTTPVIMDDKVNMSEETVRTLDHSETPISRETTTKMLSGTRNRDDNCKISKHSVLERRRKHFTVARCSSEMRAPRSVPCTG